jgi:hypothetical protein
MLTETILKRVKKAKGGTLFFKDSFTHFGTPQAVAKTVERLVQSGELVRVATGIYTRPQKDKVLGPVMPSIEDIAKAIAKRDKARILPTGSYALYLLGLSTQIPMNVVFYTDASARKVKIGKQTITFKRTSARNLAANGQISRLAIQAMRAIGKENITTEQISQIKAFLKKEKPIHIKHDFVTAPAWIQKALGFAKGKIN